MAELLVARKSSFVMITPPVASRRLTSTPPLLVYAAVTRLAFNVSPACVAVTPPESTTRSALSCNSMDSAAKLTGALLLWLRMLCAVEADESMAMLAMATHRPRDWDRDVMECSLNRILVDTQTNATVQSHDACIKIGAQTPRVEGADFRPATDRAKALHRTVLQGELNIARNHVVFC